MIDVLTYGESIEEAGYFSRKAAEFPEVAHQRHGPYFDVFGEINSLAHKQLCSLELSSTEHRKVYAACLFGRLLEACQAVVVLAARGFEQDSATLVRIALEAYLRLKVACTKPELAQKVVDSDI